VYPRIASAAADAPVELVAEALQGAQALLDLWSPTLGQRPPLCRGHLVVLGDLGQHRLDRLEAEPHLLGGATAPMGSSWSGASSKTLDLNIT
jgi:hypothetical protein